MSIIESIYENRVDEPRLVSSERKIDKDIFDLMERKGYERDNDDIADLLFASSGYGHEHGFVTGFQLAVALLLECLTY